MRIAICLRVFFNLSFQNDTNNTKKHQDVWINREKFGFSNYLLDCQARSISVLLWFLLASQIELIHVRIPETSAVTPGPP